MLFGYNTNPDISDDVVGFSTDILKVVMDTTVPKRNCKVVKCTAGNIKSVVRYEVGNII